MNWAAFPYVRISIVFIAGIIAGEYSDISSTIAFIAAGIITSAYILIQYAIKNVIFKARIKSLLMLFLTLSVGTLITVLHKEKVENAFHSDELKSEMNFIGIIDEPPVQKNKLRTFVKVIEKGKHPEQTKTCEFKLLVYFDIQDIIASGYKEGDLIYFKGNINKVRQGTNPEAFDYTKYLRYRSISHQLTVKPGKHKLIKTNAAVWYKNLAANARIQCLEILRKNIENTKELAVAQALLLGYRNLISDDLYQDFTDSGAVHVLAVSGLHVAIVITLFVFLFDKIKSQQLVWKIVKILSLSLIVWFYVLMTGASPAVMRAGLMVTVFIIGKYGARETNIYNILSIAAIWLLLFDPFLLFQASFQFSFLALLSIVYFQPFVQQLWTPSNKLIYHSWNLVSVAIAAQLLVFPVTVYYFHKFPAYFMLTGLVAIPLVYIILYSGLAMLLLEMIFPLANILVKPAFNTLLTFFVELISAIRRLPYSSIQGLWIDLAGFVLLYVAVFCFMLYLKGKNIVWFRGMLFAVFLFLLNVCLIEIRANSQNKIFFYDVYGGMLVDFYDGKKCYVIKKGNIDEKAETFATYNNRIKHRIKEVQYVTDTLEFKSYNFEKFRNCCRLGNLSACFYKSNDFGYIEQKNFQPDLLILEGDIRKIISENASIPAANTYITGRTVKQWQKQALKVRLASDSIKIHDVYLHGAFSMNKKE